MNCPFCAKEMPVGETECPHCGGSVTTPDAPSPKTPHLDELLRFSPSPLWMGCGMALLTVFGLLLTGVALFLILTARREREPLGVQLLLLIFVVAGLGAVVAGFRGLAKLATSPLQRLPAVVVGKREDDSTQYLTIETADGRKKEHSVPWKIYSELEGGDTGVAYLKGDYLLDFKPVELPRA